ncbi:hydroxyethylthiazole kinase [Clostridium polyendosporum]|uniref:Hydroxyethylthiazole kinase n=2 Tax=Clostridium polyendosporum TaxID=69208 RepID=A0A919S0G9_9CLOT|nr:hydroxyethylthiazole kinase [Clostridium polyendosporum]GIM29604.1 hydroxyethylthiazole kinase [Clostridium polyendosporum]
MEVLNSIANLLKNVREKSPLVHHITNYVTVNDCANITLAIGASPIMADDKKEVEQMVSLVSALVINIGTLNERTIESMVLAGKKANERGIPVILDPVGIGATTLRTDTVRTLINNIKFSVIKGNMSEIKLVAGEKVEIKGVDSAASEEGAVQIAKDLSKQLNCVIAITGAKDIITDGDRVLYAQNGHKLLGRVTGTGCMTASLIGSYCGANKDYLMATAAAVITMGIAGEKSMESLKDGEGIGSFKVRLFDNVFNLTTDEIKERGKVRYE